MTPNRRLDQLEPLMADSLQKIDRLIEGQGQLVELATTTKNELDQVKKTGELTANGLANLTVGAQKQFELLKTGQDELRTTQEELRVGQDELRIKVEGLSINQQELRVGQEGLRATQDDLKAGQDELRVKVEGLSINQQELSINQEELKGNQAKLMAGQELILQILREKLS